jgi:hypothetical protein
MAACGFCELLAIGHTCRCQYRTVAYMAAKVGQSGLFWRRYYFGWPSVVQIPRPQRTKCDG